MDNVSLVKDCDKICSNCKTGKLHEKNYEDWKKRKLIKYAYMIKEETKLGQICFKCIRNGIKGRKAWAYSKIPGSAFQTFDMWEECIE